MNNPSSKEGLMPSEQEQGVEPDMSWFDIAVDHTGEAFVLGSSPGWKDFEVEHHWCDTFNCDEPSHLKPGAYRWSGFKIGSWEEGDHLNIIGGQFAPIPTPDAVNAEKALASITADELGEIMQEEWGEICEDTQCHPLDMERQGRKLFYNPRHWTEAIARRLSERTTPAPDKALMPEAAVGEDEDAIQFIVRASGGRCWEDAGAVEALRLAFRAGRKSALAATNAGQVEATMRAALQDIAEAEAIPNDAAAFVWCRDVALAALSQAKEPGK